MRDAVIIGSGPNGLVAANLLADRGWNVLVLEAQPEPGGAVRSDTDVQPGYVHDTFSSFYPLAAVSPALGGLGLEAFGLDWVHAPAVIGHPLPDGDWAILHRDPELTATDLDHDHPGDGDAWLALYERWRAAGTQLTTALLQPFPPLGPGLALLARLRRAGGLGFVRLLLEPASTLAERRFGGERARLLLTGLAAHADIPLAASGSGLMGLLLAMVGHTHGFPVPRGGAGSLTRSLTERLATRGGELRCDSRVDSVLLDRGRAVGVRTADGERIRTRAVIADVPATSLYGDLIAAEDLPARVRAAMAVFDPDPATFKIDWALSGPVPWRTPPVVAPGTVHLADSTDDLALAVAQVAHHRVPARPFLLVGQMAITDPSRAPAGAESLWAYTHLPREIHADEAGVIKGGRLSADDQERFADRVQDRLRRYAPDFDSTVLARRILGPAELEERNEGLPDGALGGGTAGLHQQLIFRPIPGTGRPTTPFRGLYLASSSAHPGGAVHGACGANAARAALTAAALGRLSRSA
ncbi:phytoene desaturase family protein [Microlunatus parietis]|uniref:Pyridine nucleotide-disulfide oxidoreductase domain-containing protein 2 n=1 Tax=Microlunatus parietis TaxID=682979 RepID=A0A7Y9I3D1_9ACTN|nr:NAD(P)/FAD-dependent oxidoreductase [Microlunatus parietis]NYE69443.1 phytoene dehydrogenase-like protein [Microlunatus parietis]